MTAITFVGANAGVSGDYGTLTPTIHASAAAGDSMLLLAAVRNTAARPSAPAGWVLLYDGGNIRLWRKVHSGTESSPSVTFATGAAGDTVLAQIAVFRTLSGYLRVGPTAIANASAQNVAIPAPATPARANTLVLAIGHKFDDWTSVATLAGTEIGETLSIAGNDAAMVWDYVIQTTAAATPTGPFVVTGGASATSTGIVLALDQAVALSVQSQNAFPPRLQVSVTNLILGDAVAVYRVVAGVATLLRGGSTASATDTSFVAVDAEAPFGIPMSYLVVVSGAQYTIGSVADGTGPAYTLTTPGGKPVLSDAITGQSAEVIILAWPDKNYERPSTAYQVGGRNVVVTTDTGMGQFISQIEVYTPTDSARDNLRNLLDDPTESTLQMRASNALTHPDENCYLVVTTYIQRRYAQDGTDPQRRWILDVTEVEGWASGLTTASFTLQDLYDAFPSPLTLADVAATYATLLAVAQADLS